MDGFKQGAEYYAKEKGKDVKVVGWDGKDGLFTGGFEANETATNTARQLLDQDVDVILPVGGPIYQGALTAIDASGADVAMIGVDADVFETDPNTQDVVLTSILKNMKVSTYEAIMSLPATRSSTSRRTSARWRTTASASRRSTTSRTRCPTPWPTSWRR